MKLSNRKLKQLYEHEKAMNELNGECIMLMREHLERVGIVATFADDAAALAAQEIEKLRGKLTKCRAKVRR